MSHKKHSMLDPNLNTMALNLNQQVLICEESRVGFDSKSLY